MINEVVFVPSIGTIVNITGTSYGLNLIIPDDTLISAIANQLKELIDFVN